MACVAAERIALRCTLVPVCRAHRADWNTTGGFGSEIIADDGSTEVARLRRCARSHQDCTSMWLLVRLYVRDGVADVCMGDGDGSDVYGRMCVCVRC